MERLYPGRDQNSTGPADVSFYYGPGGTNWIPITGDWDGDGLLDLVVATPRHGSVPNPKTGLPQSLGLPGAAVLLLRNVGTEADPVFEFPRLFKFRGKGVFLGQHACSAAVAPLGPGRGPNLLVGDETGTLTLYRNDDVALVR